MVLTAQSAPQIYNGPPPTHITCAASVFVSRPVWPTEPGDHARLAMVIFFGGEQHSDSKMNLDGVYPPSQNSSLGPSNSVSLSVSLPGTSTNGDATMSERMMIQKPIYWKAFVCFLSQFYPPPLLHDSVQDLPLILWIQVIWCALSSITVEIGRASCRERVSPYV